MNTANEQFLCDALLECTGVVAASVMNRCLGFDDLVMCDGIVEIWVNSSRHKQRYCIEIPVNRWQIDDTAVARIKRSVSSSIELAESNGPP